MQFTHEHLELQKTLKRFIDAEINPHVDEWEAAEMFPAHAVFKKLGNLGLLGLTKPEAYGGAGLDYSYGMAMAETLGHVDCGGVPMAIGVQTDMCTPALARFGSEALKREFLVPAIAGDTVGCIGVSEPGAGSDVRAIQTTAIRKGDRWVLTGEKSWISLANVADNFLVFAWTDVEKKRARDTSGISAFIVERSWAGFTSGPMTEKWGILAGDTGWFKMDGVEVPGENLLGRLDEGDEGPALVEGLLVLLEDRLAGGDAGRRRRLVGQRRDCRGLFRRPPGPQAD